MSTNCNTIQSLNTLYTIIFEYILAIKNSQNLFDKQQKNFNLKKCLFHDEISMFMFWKDIEDEQTAKPLNTMNI